MQTLSIQIKKSIWQTLMRELNRRGYGERETGAFLLGDKNERIITDFVCYDDLDPHAYDSGIIIFQGDGFIPLWQRCLQKGQKVLADVHTHPDVWTGQSSSDRMHPMIAQAGHIALIVPEFATKKNQLLNGVGIHEFLGDREWKAWDENSGIIHFI